jgi:hypothetical protein
MCVYRRILKKFDKNMETQLTREMWVVIGDFKFAKSDMDEMLLAEAKEIWRKHIPPVSLEPTEEFQILDVNVR